MPQSAEVEELPAEPIKNAVSAEIEARSEEKSHIFISEDVPELETEVIAEEESEITAESVAESEPQITEVTAEEKTEMSEPVPTAAPTVPKSLSASKSAPASTEPKSGDRTVIDGKPHIWIPGFGWIVDEGGGSVGTMVGNPGDQLTGHKVGIMDGGATVGSKGDINKQVGIMGGGGSASSSTLPPAYTVPEITGDEIYVPLQPPVTKDSTPPAFKPNGEPYIHKDMP